MTQDTTVAQNPQPIMASITIGIALATPIIQVALRPLLENNVPYPVDRFLSLWVFWIAVGIAIFVSVRIEGISLATFGITHNTRTLRYRLIEMIATIIIGLVVAIVLFLFSDFVRNLLDVSSESVLDPATIPPFWVMLPAWVTAAFAEEFLFRSYAIERLSMLTGKRLLSAGIAMITFAFFHLFAWDMIHVLTFVLPGSIILTGLYLWRRSLWFVMVIHAIVNLPLLLLPLIAPYL